ncbi:TRAP transporter substrate-binding protein [Cohaesibacter haloalkalitolerans]|uniref:TRAP transporter substrate-binding protein n=1 Tax=Cohaesibacter haloalkalitolerans TaxID=1162980 RepID=UPI0013C4D836|nr:TRAP transporter substrate-binding protein [Cohaesibacter haloalkalitolerans]
MRNGKLFTLAAAALIFAAFGAQADDKHVIRIAHSGANDLGTDQQMYAWTFANYINSNSNTLEAKVFPSSSLGQMRDVIEAMQLGSGASVTVGGLGEYASFNAEIGVAGLPFIWKDYDHVHRVFDGEVGKSLAADMDKIGFKVLSYGDSWGYRHVATAKKAINSPEDLKGLKIRTIPNKVFVASVNSMGANATPMNYGEIYTSLESGVLDGFEHTAATILTGKFYEVASHLTLTKHMLDPTFLVMSKMEWNKLSDLDKDVVQKGAKLASDVVRALAPQRENEALAALKENGVTVTEIDTSSFQKAAASVQDELAKELGATDLLEEIRAQ